MKEFIGVLFVSRCLQQPLSRTRFTGTRAWSKSASSSDEQEKLPGTDVLLCFILQHWTDFLLLKNKDKSFFFFFFFIILIIIIVIVIILYYMYIYIYM